MNALTKIVKRPSPGELARKALADAERKRSTLSKKLTQYEQARERYATDVELGGADAQAALDRVNVEIVQATQDAANLDAALAGLRERVREAEAAEAADVGLQKRKQIARLLNARLDLAASIDGTLRALAVDTRRMAELSETISALIGESELPEFERRELTGMIAPESVRSRLLMSSSNHHALGGALMLNRLPSASDLDPVNALNPPSFTDREAKVHVAIKQQMGCR